MYMWCVYTTWPPVCVADAHHMYTCVHVTQADDVPVERRDWCLPSEVGLEHTLPDGVAMHIRLRRVGDRHQVRVWPS